MKGMFWIRSGLCRWWGIELGDFLNFGLRNYDFGFLVLINPKSHIRNPKSKSSFHRPVDLNFRITFLHSFAFVVGLFTLCQTNL
jgi:hypothetical protein